jgi:hypothetical protein
LPFAIVVMVLPGVLNASFMNHERLKGQIALSGPLPFGSAVAWWVAVRPAGRAAPEADATRVVHGDPRCVAGHVLVRRGRRRESSSKRPSRPDTAGAMCQRDNAWVARGTHSAAGAGAISSRATER